MNDDQLNEMNDRIGKLETRFEALTRNYAQLVDALQAKLGTFSEPAETKPKRPTLEAVPGARPCPEHPRAIQTENGCSAPGCTQPLQLAHEA